MANSVYWYECQAPLERAVTTNIAVAYHFVLLDFIPRADMHMWWTDNGGTVGDARFNHYLAIWQLTPGVIPDGSEEGLLVYFLGTIFWLDVVTTIYDVPPADRECPIKQFGFPV